MGYLHQSPLVIPQVIPMYSHMVFGTDTGAWLATLSVSGYNSVYLQGVPSSPDTDTG